MLRASGSPWTARVNLSTAQGGKNHDANNRITQNGGSTLSYDDNGNLLSDGTNTYTWNSRNQLASLSGPVAASFQYDALGRRKQKTVAGATTKYLYDGANILQELSAANAVIANNLPGLGIDELFTRTEGATVKTILADALGSTIAIADATSLPTSWTYEPYGKATFTGVAQSNSQLYTGRELDGTGLYFYRARYYHPSLQRFVGEDPIEYAAGPNVYAYVGGNPVSYEDPFGLNPLAGAIEGAEVGFAGGGPWGAAAGAVIGGIAGYLIADQVSDAILNSGQDPLAPAGDAEHTKGARPSTKGDHEKGQANRDKSRGGEKGDANRGWPRRRPQDWQGPWPPKKPKAPGCQE